MTDRGSGRRGRRTEGPAQGPAVNAVYIRRRLGGTPTASAMLLLGAAAIGATVLRVLFLGRSFSMDEVHSIRLAQQDWSAFVATVFTDQANMALYYWLLRIWRMIGENEATIRLLSVLSAIAVIPVIYAIGTHLFGRQAGLLGAVLTAVNAYHVQYAQYARSYSLVVFLVALSTWFFVRGIEERSATHWVGYVFASVLAVYSHFFALFVLAAHAVSLLFLPRREIPWTPLLRSVMIIGCAFLPLAAFVVTRDRGQIAWVPPPHPTNVIGVFYVLAGGTGRLAEAGTIGKALFLEYFALCVIAVAAAAKGWARSRTSFELWRYGLPVVWLFVPIMLAYAISQFKPIFVAYYLIVSLPALMLLGASGLAVLPRNLTSIMLAVLVAFAMHEVFAYYAAGQTEDLRGASYRTLETALPGDALLFYAPYADNAFAYYRGRFPGPAPTLTVLPRGSKVPADTRRVWLFLSEDEPYRTEIRSLQASLVRRYSSIMTWKFAGVQLLLYSNDHVDR